MRDYTYTHECIIEWYNAKKSDGNQSQSDLLNKLEPFINWLEEDEDDEDEEEEEDDE